MSSLFFPRALIPALLIYVILKLVSIAITGEGRLFKKLSFVLTIPAILAKSLASIPISSLRDNPVDSGISPLDNFLAKDNSLPIGKIISLLSMKPIITINNNEPIKIALLKELIPLAHLESDQMIRLQNWASSGRIRSASSKLIYLN